MKKVFCIILMLVSLGALLPACKETADDVQTRQTEVLMSEAQRQVGLPNIVNFQQRKTLKTILELCDKENLVRYAYFQNIMTGKLVYIGRCLGYGIPFSAQYTNPKKVCRKFGERTVLPQPDPNGLFMPSSSSATWLLLIDPKTKKPKVMYIEPKLVVSPIPMAKGLVENYDFFLKLEESYNK